MVEEIIVIEMKLWRLTTVAFNGVHIFQQNHWKEVCMTLFLSSNCLRKKTAPTPSIYFLFNTNNFIVRKHLKVGIHGLLLIILLYDVINVCAWNHAYMKLTFLY